MQFTQDWENTKLVKEDDEDEDEELKEEEEEVRNIVIIISIKKIFIKLKTKIYLIMYYANCKIFIFIYKWNKFNLLKTLQPSLTYEICLRHLH